MILVVCLLFATTLLSGHVAVYVARRSRSEKSGFRMVQLAAATAWWAFWNALEHLAQSLDFRIAFSNLEYAAISTIPVLWFSFGFFLTQEGREETPRLPRLLIWVIPAATTVLVWLDPLLGLVRHSFHLVLQSGILVTLKDYGPWFWVHSAYSYALVIWGTVHVLNGLRERRLAQRLSIVAGAFLPVASNLLYVSRLVPLAGIDPTPLALALTSLLLVLNLSKFRFLALVRVAQAAAVEQLRDAVVMVDRDRLLAYANTVARIAFRLSSVSVGKTVGELGPPLSALSLEEESVVELVHEGRRYEAHVGKIVRRGRLVGSVMTFFDVTRRVSAEENLQETNSRLEKRIVERTTALEESNQRLTVELEQRRRAEKLLSHDVLHDPLTGVANRSLALARIEQLAARCRRDPKASFGVLYVGLDGFKSINDNFGHNAGDSLLCEVSARLKRSVREVDLVCRVRGDEFALVIDGMGSTEEGEEVADRVADALCVPVTFGQGTVIPAASIGILVGTPDYREPGQVLRDAEIAMGRAKSTGKNQRAVFTEGMRLEARERNRMASALRVAVTSSGISLAYQPIVRMDGALAGWEVLARWQHPELGEIPPD